MDETYAFQRVSRLDAPPSKSQHESFPTNFGDTSIARETGLSYDKKMFFVTLSVGISNQEALPSAPLTERDASFGVEMFLIVELERN